MKKAILIGIALAAIVWAFAVPVTAYACGCPTDPWEFSALTDTQRWSLYNGGCALPDAPPGYKFEDLTIVPESF